MKTIDYNLLDLNTFDDYISNFNTLDCYGKIEFMGYVCSNVKDGLEGIVNEGQAWDFIDNLMDVLIKYFNVFLQDNELNKEENIGANSEYFFHLINSIIEIAPLIKARNASYKYLIGMLKSFDDAIQDVLPKNIKLARLFQGLLHNKSKICEQIGVNEDDFESIVNKMLSDVDSINSILTSSDNNDFGTR